MITSEYVTFDSISIIYLEKNTYSRIIEFFSQIAWLWTLSISTGHTFIVKSYRNRDPSGNRLRLPKPTNSCCTSPLRRSCTSVMKSECRSNDANVWHMLSHDPANTTTYHSHFPRQSNVKFIIANTK